MGAPTMLRSIGKTLKAPGCAFLQLEPPEANEFTAEEVMCRASIHYTYLALLLARKENDCCSHSLTFGFSVLAPSWSVAS